MESIAPSSQESSALYSEDSSPVSSVGPQVEFTQEQAIQELGNKLPELESLCEDIRRCYGAVLENCYVARNRLKVLKSGDSNTEDTRAAIMEFLYAVDQIKNAVEAVALAARQTEHATNEMVQGARGMTKI